VDWVEVEGGWMMTWVGHKGSFPHAGSSYLELKSIWIHLIVPCVLIIIIERVVDVYLKKLWSKSKYVIYLLRPK